MNLYQIDDYNNNTLTVEYDGVPVNYEPVSYGTNICGNSSADAVVKVLYTVPHSSSNFNMKLLLNQKAKIGINNLRIFLQGCASCSNDFGYTIRAIPRYSYSIPNNGIDVWAHFNSRYHNSSYINTNTYQGSLGPLTNVAMRGARLLQNNIPLTFEPVSTYNDIRLFTQPGDSSLNQDLNTAVTSPAQFTTLPGG